VPVTKPGYFPILDNLRFLASAGVFLAHSVVFFSFPGAVFGFPVFLKDAGYYGVIFFYTLSGFLITYLLMKEKRRTGTIAADLAAVLPYRLPFFFCLPLPGAR